MGNESFFVIDKHLLGEIRQTIQWRKNFRVSGGGASFTNTPTSAALCVPVPRQKPQWFLDMEFWAKVTSSTAVSGGGGGYKYSWTEQQRTELGFVDITDGRTGDKAEDTFALSLAEINGTSTGPLKDGDFVLIRISAGDDNVTRYTIIETAEDDAVTVRIDSNATGGGKYIGVLLAGTSTADGTANLAMPEGMTAGDAALILHLPEDGKPTHWIELGTTATGVVIGRTDEETPKWIVAIPNGTYRTVSPDSLSVTGLTADTHSWARDDVAAGDQYGDNPIESTTERVEWDDGTGELVKFVRTVLHDAGGNKVSESAETRVVIVAFGEC